MTRGKLHLFLICWGVCLVISFFLDAPISRWLYAHDFHSQAAGIMRSTPWARVMKSLGDFRYVTLLLVLLVIVRQLKWKEALLALACAGTSILSEPGKFLLARSRPVVDNVLQSAFDFAPFQVRDGGGSMPSGHALLSFATAVCLTRYHPKWGIAAFFVATVVSAERVLEASHFLSDVVLSAGMAILMSNWLLNWYDQRIAAAKPRAKKEEIPA